LGIKQLQIQILQTIQETTNSVVTNCTSFYFSIKIKHTWIQDSGDNWENRWEGTVTARVP